MDTQAAEHQARFSLLCQVHLIVSKFLLARPHFKITTSQAWTNAQTTHRGVCSAK